MFNRNEETYDSIIGKMVPYVEDTGRAIVKSEANLKDPLLFTRLLLEFKDVVDIMVDQSFDNNMKF